MDNFASDVTFAFEISSVNGALEPWLNSEDDISTFGEIYQLINTLIETANSEVVGDYTGMSLTDR